MCNHCYSEKAIINSHPESVFVAIGIQHAMPMRHSVICGLRGSIIFSTLFHKRRDFRKKFLHIKRGLLCFATFLNTFLIPRRVQRYATINEDRSS